MRTTHRDYAEEAGDFRRLARLLTDDPDHVRGHTTWCLGRLADWKHGLWGQKSSIPRFCERNAQLWFDALGDLVAVTISEEGGPQVAVLTTRGHRFLFEEVLAWAVTNWGERGALSVEITEAATVEAAALERSGFRQASVFHAYTFDLARPLPEAPPLPDGFTLVDMASQPDYRARRLLRAEAFEGRGDLSEVELARDLELDAAGRESPIYHAETDVYVRSEDGRLVAGCEALIDARNAAADVERICTHSAFRRRGLARAAIHDCLRRLRDMGMARAHIAGYSREALALYGSLGAVAERACVIYRQDS
jgi:GNAT superfamily N-acetyltransferase